MLVDQKTAAFRLRVGNEIHARYVADTTCEFEKLFADDVHTIRG